MNRTTNQIFKKIYKYGVIGYDSFESTIPNKTAFKQSIDILIQEKLIDIRDNYIELTVDGYDYYFNKRKSFFINLLKIIIVPLLITVISSYITAKIIKSGDTINNNYYLCEDNYDVTK